MKRKREIIVEKKTEIKSAIDELSLLIKLNTTNNYRKSSSSAETATATIMEVTINSNCTVDRLQQDVVVCSIPTRPFLSLCSSILQVLDKIGPTMAVLRQDMFNNIQRLEMLYETNPATYSYLVDILNKEAVERNAKKGDSSSKALVWLTRALDFTAALLQKLVIDPRGSMEQIVGDAYEITLKPWHGWISAAAVKVALKLVPDTSTFISLLQAKDQDLDSLKDEIQLMLSLLVPLLDDLHSTLNSYGLAKLKST